MRRLQGGHFVLVPQSNGKLSYWYFLLTPCWLRYRLNSPDISPTGKYEVIHCLVCWFYSSLTDLPPYLSSRKLNELDIFSYYLHLFLEPSHKLSRILNSTMARIHLFMCGFLIPSVLSTTTISKYLSLELLIQLSTALLNIIITLRRNLILF